MSSIEIQTYEKLSLNNLDTDLKKVFKKYKKVLINLGALNMEEINKFLENIKIFTEDGTDLHTQYFYENPGFQTNKFKLLGKDIGSGLFILSNPYLSKNNEFWLTLSVYFDSEDLTIGDGLGTYKYGAGKLLFMIMKEFYKEFSDIGVYITCENREPLCGIENLSEDLFSAEFMIIPKKLLEIFPNEIKNNIPRNFSKQEFSDYIAFADMKLWKVEPWREK